MFLDNVNSPYIFLRRSCVDTSCTRPVKSRRTRCGYKMRISCYSSQSLPVCSWQIRSLWGATPLLCDADHIWRTPSPTIEFLSFLPTVALFLGMYIRSLLKSPQLSSVSSHVIKSSYRFVKRIDEDTCPSALRRKSPRT